MSLKWLEETMFFLNVLEQQDKASFMYDFIQVTK